VVSLTGWWACLINPCVNIDAPVLLIRSVPSTVLILQNFTKVRVLLEQYLNTTSRDYQAFG
jgi:hypothetical protein